MPKLSRYLGSRNETNVSLIDRNVPESGHGVPAIQSRKEIPRSEQEDREVRGRVDEDSRLADVLRKRVKDYGERQYRWDDGTMRSSRPPRNPYAVASRQSWRSLVRYCREHGGDREFEKKKESLRYGLSVSYGDHVEHLRGLGLAPETDDAGHFIDFDSNKTNPLQDKDHAFNSFYHSEAKYLFDM
eukprot:jgi/Picre1/34757/NNA_002223.t1